MPRKPTILQKLVMRARRWSLTRKIRTKEQAQMIHEEALKELQRRKAFFEKYKANFDVKNDGKKTIIVILGPNNEELSFVHLILDKDNNWYAWRFATGKFENSRELHRDLGFAKALIEKIMEEAKKRGIKRIEFDAVNRNVKFFEKLGAIKTKEQPHPFTTKMYIDV